MKKLISLLVGVSFISFLSFGTLMAQDEGAAVAQSSDKIGLNIKAFLGLGKGEVKWEEGDASNKIKTKFSFPAINLGVTYQIIQGLEAGLSYNFNTFKIKEPEFFKDLKVKLHQISIDTIYTFTMVPYVQPYVGLGLIPFMKIKLDDESSERKETPKFAFAGIIGAKYAINDLVGLFTQLSYEKSLQAKWDEEEWNSDEEMEEISYKLSISSFQLLFGVGVSL